MPYIKLYDRLLLDRGHRLPSTAGELNYAITRMVDTYLNGALSYDRINSVIGVLECAKLELYRRVAAPYENGKIHENGDVYKCNNDILKA